MTGECEQMLAGIHANHCETANNVADELGEM